MHADDIWKRGNFFFQISCVETSRYTVRKILHLNVKIWSNIKLSYKEHERRREILLSYKIALFFKQKMCIAGNKKYMSHAESAWAVNVQFRVNKE